MYSTRNPTAAIVNAPGFFNYVKKKKSIIRRSAAKNTFGCLKQESFVSG